MSIFYAVILGILQGLSEFIPISSTAHLTIAGKAMGIISADHPEHWTAFIAVIQLGTLAAVLIYFAKDIRAILIAFFSQNFGSKKLKYSDQNIDSKLGWYVILGSIPIMTIGLGLKKIIEGSLTKELHIIAYSLIGLAVFLALADRTAKLNKDMDKTTWLDALIVGLAQCLALIPGASRSGTTITAGLFLGMKRETAARFSFLLSIPAVFGSGLLEFYQSLKYINSGDLLNMIIATFAAAVSGYFAIAFLLNFLKTRSTMVFVAYHIILGVIVLWFLAR